MPQSLITAKYQTTVPKEVRQKLDLRSGDVLRWEVVGRDIRIVPPRRGFLDRRGSLRVGPGSVVDDVRQARAQRPLRTSPEAVMSEAKRVGAILETSKVRRHANTRRCGMPMIQNGAQLTPGQLLKAVEQMPPEDLDRFVEQVVVLRASQRAPRLSQAESELLEKINQGLPASDQRQYDELVARREIADLPQDENAEFLRLTCPFGKRA